MIYFVLLVAFSLPSAILGGPAPGVIYAAAPEERGAFHVGGKGVYNYGYNTGDGIAKVEVRNPDGSVYGSYRYFDPEGKQILRSYVADDRGFRVLGNELPVSPDAPLLELFNEQTLLGTVEGEKRKSGHYISLEEPPTLATFNAGVEKHKEAVRLQEEVIRQQTEILERLREQQRNVVEQRNSHNQYGYIETSSNVVSSPYLYGEDYIHYDFPAGFTYNAPAVEYNVVYPVGVQGHHEVKEITAGHEKNVRARPIYVERKRPVRLRYRRPDLDKYWRRAERPYVIGHAK